MNLAALVESARVGADALRTKPMRTALSTTGVIIGVAALVAAFSITDGVDVWSRGLIARESSVQDVAVTPITVETNHKGAELSGSRLPGPRFRGCRADKCRNTRRVEACADSHRDVAGGISRHARGRAADTQHGRYAARPIAAWPIRPRRRRAAGGSGNPCTSGRRPGGRPLRSRVLNVSRAARSQIVTDRGDRARMTADHPL